MQFNKKIIVLLSCIVLSAPFTAFAGMGKLDPQLGLLVAYPQRLEMMKQQGKSLRKSTEGWEINAIITFRGGVEDLQKAGVKIRCVVGDIAVASIPFQQLEAISELPSVIYIESCQADRALLNESGPVVGAVKARTDLGYTGEGVIVGIIDSGIDWRHRDFCNPNGTTRIKYLLDLSQNGSVYGGRLYTEEEINAALQGSGFIDQYDYVGHGTHVAGIAAGDGSATSTFGSYAGMAPKADIVIVKATSDELSQKFFTDDQITALAFVDSVAAVLGEPYVVNLSFGGNSGAHDGTAPTERAIRQMVGAGIPGKAIVTVAGNNREDDIHAQAVLSASSKTADVTFRVDPYTRQSGTENDLVQIDAWYDGTAKISVTITSPSGSSLGPLVPGGFDSKNTSSGFIYAWNSYYEDGDRYVPGINPNNGDREIQIDIYDATAQMPPESGLWTLRFSGDPGKLDAWISSASMNVSFVDGNVPTGKVSIPGTAENAITVGAFVTKNSWEDKDGHRFGNDLEKGNIASFTNPGPTRTGDVKPDISAPGEVVASTLSGDAMPGNGISIFESPLPGYPNALILPGEFDAIASGTSMAAPHVTGAVALLLQKYPQASADQLKDLLIRSANVDAKVGTVPNNDWGFGKLNIYAALQLEPDTTKTVPEEYHLVNVYPNPFSSVAAIKFELTTTQGSMKTQLRIFNSLGQQVRTIIAAGEQVNAGNNIRYWDGRDDLGYPLAAGVYFAQLITGSNRAVKKLVFLGGKR